MAFQYTGVLQAPSLLYVSSLARVLNVTVCSQALRSVHSGEGAAGLMRGWAPTLARDAPYVQLQTEEPPSTIAFYSFVGMRACFLCFMISSSTLGGSKLTGLPLHPEPLLAAPRLRSSPLWSHSHLTSCAHACSLSSAQFTACPVLVIYYNTDFRLRLRGFGHGSLNARLRHLSLGPYLSR